MRPPIRTLDEVFAALVAPDEQPEAVEQKAKPEPKPGAGSLALAKVLAKGRAQGRGIYRLTAIKRGG